MSFAARVATPADVPALFALVNAAYKIEIGATGRAFKDVDRLGSPAEIIPEDYLVIVEKESGEIVAGARVILLPDTDVPCFLYGSKAPIDPVTAKRAASKSRVGIRHASVGPFAVSPAHQGRRIAPELLKGVEARALELGATAMEIVIGNFRTDVQPFWVRNGYVYQYTATYTGPHIIRPTALYIHRKSLV